MRSQTPAARHLRNGCSRSREVRTLAARPARALLCATPRRSHSTPGGRRPVAHPVACSATTARLRLIRNPSAHTGTSQAPMLAFPLGTYQVGMAKCLRKKKGIKNTKKGMKLLATAIHYPAF
jgi:hypothetical protein